MRQRHYRSTIPGRIGASTRARDAHGHFRTGPVTARVALLAFLAERPGSVAEIARATGYAYQTIENNVAQIRREKHELAERVRDGRKRYPDAVAVPEVWHPRSSDGHLPAVVAKAIALRSPLERVWR